MRQDFELRTPTAGTFEDLQSAGTCIFLLVLQLSALVVRILNSGGGLRPPRYHKALF